MSKASELGSSEAFGISLGNYRLSFIGTLAAWYLPLSSTRLGRCSIFLDGLITMCVVIFAIAFVATTSNTASTWTQSILLVGWVFV